MRNSNNTASIQLSLTLYSGRTRPKGRRCMVTWGEWAARLRRHTIQDRKDGALWSPAGLDPERPYRANANVRSISCLAGDVDDYTPPETFQAPLIAAGVEHVLY